MRAMVLENTGEQLVIRDVPKPTPKPGQVLVKVRVCGLCRTDLHVVDGDLTEPNLPVIPGHQIIGLVESTGSEATGFSAGDRVGIPWLGGSCGHCGFCSTGQENLCDKAQYTGYQINGGFAEYCIADSDFCFPIPDDYPDLQAAPLLCAGLIGYRSLTMAGEGKKLGLYGFGAAAHIITQVARYQDRHVYAFLRAGDESGAQFARELGACWTGTGDQMPPEQLDSAIIFAPAGELVPAALKAVRKGGTVVCAGIHMSNIPSFPYADLWGERVLRSVANLTRHDGEEFLKLAPRVPVRTTVHPYPLESANEALSDLRNGRFDGAAVIVVDPSLMTRQ